MGKRTIKDVEVSDFAFGYLIAALWSSNDSRDDSGGQPLDDTFDVDDIDADTLRTMLSDCEQFQKDNAADLSAYCEQRQPRGDYSAEECAGHDFWLSRNGHGAGFFDRSDVSEDVRERLQEAAHVGEFNLYVDKDFDADADEWPEDAKVCGDGTYNVLHAQRCRDERQPDFKGHPYTPKAAD